ncbi:MAG: hypothetical protein ACLFU5_08885, partial [Thermoplasmata archaeon]
MEVIQSSGEQVMRINITAVGITNESAWSGTQYHYVSPASIKLFAQLGDNAPDGANIHLREEYNQRGNVTEKENDVGGEKEELMEDLVVWGIEEGADAVAWPLGLTVSGINFFLEHHDSGGAKKVYDDSDTGPNAEVSEKFRVRPRTLPEGYDYPSTGEDDQADRTYIYDAATQISVAIPDDKKPDTLDIKLTAKQRMGYWETVSAGDTPSEQLDSESGAEASVEIPIRNAEPDPDLVEDLDTDKEDYEASE